MVTVRLGVSLIVGSTSSQSMMVVEGQGTGQTVVVFSNVPAAAFGEGGNALLLGNHPSSFFRRLRAELVARSCTRAASRPRPNQPMANGTCPLAGAIG